MKRWIHASTSNRDLYYGVYRNDRLHCFKKIPQVIQDRTFYFESEIPPRGSWRSYYIAFDALDNDVSTDPVYGEFSKIDDLRKALNSYIQSGDRYGSGLKDAPGWVMEYA